MCFQNMSKGAAALWGPVFFLESLEHKNNFENSQFPGIPFRHACMDGHGWTNGKTYGCMTPSIDILIFVMHSK